MEPEELRHFRARLIAELAKALRAVDADLRDSVVDRAYRWEQPEDEADAGARELVDDVKLRLDERTGARVEALEDALDRMARGRYGRCVDCGCEIPRARLEALPWAERCAEDQARIEREHREHPPTL